MVRILSILLLLLSFSIFARGQSYYKVTEVYDNNMNPLPSNNMFRMGHIGKYVIVMYIGDGISVKYHNGSSMFVPYAGQDSKTGNHFYAPKVLGQPVYMDMFGNYTFVQFEAGTNNMLIANAGIMDGCEPVTEEDYFAYVGIESITSSSSSYVSPNINQDTPSESSTTWKECIICHGTGYQQGYTSTPYYGGVRVKEYCSVCKRRVYPHTHKPCSRCHGTGRVE